jgi:hypothetical protein
MYSRSISHVSSSHPTCCGLQLAMGATLQPDKGAAWHLVLGPIAHHVQLGHPVSCTLKAVAQFCYSMAAAVLWAADGLPDQM